MLLFKSKQKFLVMLTVVLSAVHSLNNVFLAVILGNVIDAATEGDMNAFLTSAGIGFVGFILFMFVGLGMIQSKTLLLKQLNLVIKNTLIEDIVSYSGNTEDHSNDLSYMTNDLKQLETKGLEAEIKIVQLVFTFVFALIAALYYDVWITLAFFFGSLAPVILSLLFQGKIGETSQQWSESNSNYTNRLKDYFKGIETVRTYQVEKRVIERASEQAEEMEESLRQMNKTVEMINQFVYIAAMVFSLLVPFGVGVYRIIQFGVSIGTFIAIVQLSNSLTNPVMQVLELVNGYGTTKSIRARYLKAQTRVRSSSRITEENGFLPQFESIQLEELHVEVGDKELFRNVDLEISDKDKILLIGPSGSGKSSLLRVIQQTLPMSKGKYLFNGKEADKQLKTQFSLITQQPLIFDESIRYNITLGEEYRDEEVEEAVQAAQLDEVVLEKGLDYPVGEYGKNLSGGQLQRIEIARALIRKRPIILADEMTSALDDVTAYKVRRALLDLPSTLIEVAHKVSEEEKENYTKIWDVSELSV